VAPSVFVLRIQGPEAGPWTVGLGTPGSVPATDTLDPSAVALLQTSTDAELGRPGRVLVPGRDKKQVRAEARVGQLLLDATSRSPALQRMWGAVAAALGQAGGVILVDAHPESARRLPWELLAHTPDAPPMVFSDGVVIARLHPGPPRSHPPMVPPVPAIWRLSTEADPTAELVQAGLTAAWGQPLAPPPSSGATWLHLVAHGSVDDTSLGLSLGSREADSSSIGDQLAAAVRQAAMVVLAVCHGGGALQTPLHELPAQLLYMGAAVVVGPDRTVSPEALAAFARGLAGAAPDTPLHAVAAGWRALRAAALPWPDARWHRLRVFVSQADGLLVSLAPPAQGLAGHLTRAQSIALELQSGFCGVEHLLLSLLHHDVPRPLLALQYRARLHEARIRSHLAAFQPTRPPPEVPHWSPRLAPLVSSSDARMTLDRFWRPLLLQAGPLLSELLELPAHTTAPDASFDTVGTVGWTEQAAAEAFEILGGPEDGRRLTPAPGDWLGRPSQSAPSAWSLYEDTVLIDPRVSRQHLRWEGAGTVWCRKTSTVAGVPARGTASVRVGDIVQLGGATRLLGVG
jgi:hypothetical protein